MEQHGPAQHRLRRDGGHGAGRMAPHIVADGGGSAGQGPRRAAALAGIRPVTSGYASSTGSTYRPHSRRSISDSSRSAAMLPSSGARRCSAAAVRSSTVKAQHRCEAQRPHDAQGVLVKAAVRLPHAAQERRGAGPPCRRGRSTSTPRRSMAMAFTVRSRRRRSSASESEKVHRVGAAMVGVGAVGAEGGDLYGKALLPDSDGAVLQSRGDAAAREQGGASAPVGRRWSTSQSCGYAAQQQCPARSRPRHRPR